MYLLGHRIFNLHHTVIAMVFFYLLVLGVGIWASIKSRRKENKSAADKMEKPKHKDGGGDLHNDRFSITLHYTFKLNTTRSRLRWYESRNHWMNHFSLQADLNYFQWKVIKVCLKIHQSESHANLHINDIVINMQYLRLSGLSFNSSFN